MPETKHKNDLLALTCLVIGLTVVSATNRIHQIKTDKEFVKNQVWMDERDQFETLVQAFQTDMLERTRDCFGRIQMQEWVNKLSEANKNLAVPPITNE